MPFDVADILQQYGLPTLVALWFMLRSDRRQDMIISKLTVLTVAVAVIAKTLDLDEETAHLLAGPEDNQES